MKGVNGGKKASKPHTKTDHLRDRCTRMWEYLVTYLFLGAESFLNS